MKFIQSLQIGILCLMCLAAQAQQPKIAVLDFDTREYQLGKQQVIQYLINELNRVGGFEVLDKYEVEYVSKRDSIDQAGCFAKVCMHEFGRKLFADKILTGNIMLLGDKINVTIRLFDVETQRHENTVIREFLKINGNELAMIRITINEMFGIENDQQLVKKLTQQAEYDNTVNNPYKLILRADGPRMGMVYFNGINGQILKNASNHGGYNGYPFMFQFGYQFEKQYLNEGNLQALIEFIPMITGMDQSRVVPSFSILNGLRSNKNGWEFAFGPTFNLLKTAKGFYYDTDGNGTDEWLLHSAASLYPDQSFDMERRADSRGVITVTTGFVFAAGKTFKSGKMNVPVNLYFIPNPNGARMGLSFGWNAKERYNLNKD